MNVLIYQYILFIRMMYTIIQLHFYVRHISSYRHIDNLTHQPPPPTLTPPNDLIGGT
jgi:hypothetical protein